MNRWDAGHLSLVKWMWDAEAVQLSAASSQLADRPDSLATQGRRKIPYISLRSGNENLSRGGRRSKVAFLMIMDGAIQHVGIPPGIPLAVMFDAHI